jgi:hypothetical protein
MSREKSENFFVAAAGADADVTRTDPLHDTLALRDEAADDLDGFFVLVHGCIITHSPAGSRTTWGKFWIVSACGYWTCGCAAAPEGASVKR